MKHIFTIHSPLTFLMAYSVVEHLQLDRADVILLSQKYQVPIDGFRVVPAFQNLQTKWYQKIRNLNFPKSYDRYIDSITGGVPFTAYVDLMSYYQKILVTHTNCAEFHFMEEGNSAYQAKDDLTDLTWSDRHHGYRVKNYTDPAFLKALVRVLRGYNLRLINIPYHYMAYTTFDKVKFFSFSNNAFFNAPPEKKVLVKPDPDAPELKRMAKEIYLEDEVVWIDGANGRYTGLSNDYYERAIQQAITVLSNRGILRDKVYVKLRPGIVNVADNYLASTLADAGFEAEIMPDGLVLESFFITSRSCHVIGTLTAALEYAHVFGHKAYSIYGLFDKQPPTFFDRMTGFWQNIELLEA